MLLIESQEGKIHLQYCVVFLIALQDESSVTTHISIDLNSSKHCRCHMYY